MYEMLGIPWRGDWTSHGILHPYFILKLVFSSRDKGRCWGCLNEWFSKGIVFGLKWLANTTRTLSFFNLRFHTQRPNCCVQMMKYGKGFCLRVFAKDSFIGDNKITRKRKERNSHM